MNRAENAQSGRIWTAIYALGLLVLTWCLCWKTFDDGVDVWSHAAIGRWMVENGQVARKTLFWWSTDRPWIAHSWASQVLLYQLVKVGGPFLWLVYNFVSAATSFAILWHLWSRRARPGVVAAVAFLLALLASERRFQARPESLTGVCLALLLAFLVWWQSAPRDLGFKPSLIRPPVPVLPVLFVAWANLHGAVALGIAFLGLTALGDAIQDRFSPRCRALFVLTAICAAAVCVNPAGWHLWSVLLPIRDSVQFRWIDEWKPVWQDPIFSPSATVAAAVLWSMALVAWWRGGRRLAFLLWLLVIGLAFLSARRNVWALSLTALAVLSAAPSTLSPALLGSEISSATRRIARVGVAVLLGVILVVYWPPEPGRTILVSQNLANFLSVQPAGTRILNHYDQSPYLEWRLAGKPPLFVDVNNAYPDAVFLDFLHVLQVSPRGQAMLNSGLFQLVVMPLPKTGDDVPLLFRFLNSSARWTTVYRADDGIVWKYVGPSLNGPP